MECEPTMKGCNGAWLDTYFVSASCRGQGYETDFPYNARDTNKCPSNTARSSILQDMQLKWAEIPPTSAELELAVNYAPTQIGIMVSNAFYSAGVIPCDADSYITSYTNHAVTVVGYGTGKSSSGTTLDYFLIKNSWGTGWGDGGYLRVQKGCTTSATNYGPCQIHLDPPIVPVL